MASKLFSALELPGGRLSHRMIFGPMTRSRAHPVTLAPHAHNAEYYAARATEGGLMISEAAAAELAHRGYARQPGAWSEEQLDGWKAIVDAVGARGSQYWIQLMHAGRYSHPSLTGGVSPLSAFSRDRAPGDAYLMDGSVVPFGSPRVASEDDLKQVVQEMADGARRVVESGAAGVQLHFANAYFLHEMLSSQTNRREDVYGGEGRLTWPLALVDAVVDVIGREKVSIRVSPGTTYGAIQESDDEVNESYPPFLREVAKRNIAFVEVCDWNRNPQTGERSIKTDLFEMARSALGGGTVLVGNGGFVGESAEEALASGSVDAVSFSSAWLTHPDLYSRLRNGDKVDYGLAYQHIDKWYGPVAKNEPSYEEDAKGYTDW